MTGEEKPFQLSSRRLVAERGPRRLRVEPPQDPSVLGCTEASSEYVVEGIQVPPPPVVAEQPRELPGKAVEVGEPGSVDDQHGKVVIAVGHAPCMALLRSSAHAAGRAPRRPLLPMSGPPGRTHSWGPSPVCAK